MKWKFKFRTFKFLSNSNNKARRSRFSENLERSQFRTFLAFTSRRPPWQGRRRRRPRHDASAALERVWPARGEANWGPSGLSRIGLAKTAPSCRSRTWESSPPFRSVRASAQNARGSSPHGLSPKSHGCGSEGEKPAKNERGANPGAQTSPALALPAPASCWCLPCRTCTSHGPTAPRADRPTGRPANAPPWSTRDPRPCPDAQTSPAPASPPLPAPPPAGSRPRMPIGPNL